jgi:hypothetical protein
VCKDLACKVDFAEPNQTRGQACFYKQQDTQGTDSLDFLVCTKSFGGLLVEHRIHRLQDDMLLTHSAPATMRKYPNDIHNKETYVEAGELIIWRWLGVDRFFPPGYEDAPPTVLRGCSSVSRHYRTFNKASL